LPPGLLYSTSRHTLPLPDLEPTSFGWPAKSRCTGGDVDVSPLPRVPLLLSAVRRRPTRPYTPVRRGRAGNCSRFVLQCILAIRNGKPRGCETCLALPSAYSPRRFRGLSAIQLIAKMMYVGLASAMTARGRPPLPPTPFTR